MKIFLAAVGCVMVAAITATFTRSSLVWTVAASTPGTDSITVPSTIGQTVSVTWTGSIPPLVNATSNCTSFADTALVDQHVSTINVPAGVYNTVAAQFIFKITWTPVVNSNTSDEVLTVVGLGSSDGGNRWRLWLGRTSPGQLQDRCLRLRQRTAAALHRHTDDHYVRAAAACASQLYKRRDVLWAVQRSRLPAD